MHSGRRANGAESRRSAESYGRDKKKRETRSKRCVRVPVRGPPGLLVLIGPEAPGHAATTSKVRYVSSAAGKMSTHVWKDCRGRERKKDREAF